MKTAITWYLTADGTLNPRHSPSSIAFFIAVLILLALITVPDYSESNRIFKRPVYWCLVVATAFCAAMITAPDWQDCILVGTCALLALTMNAYMYTDNIKISGRTYTYFRQHKRESGSRSSVSGDALSRSARGQAHPVYPSLVSASKFWWTLVVAMIICSPNVAIYAVTRDGFRPALVCGVLILIIAVAFGHRDAIHGLPIAQGQRLQFVVIAIITAMIFPALYLLAYSVAKKQQSR